MRLCAETEADFFRGHPALPDSWIAAMSATGSVSDLRHVLVRTIRDVGPESDRILHVLLEDRFNTDLACQAVAVALIPLLNRRCRVHPGAVDDVLVELCAVVGDVIRDGIPDTRRHLANVFVDRAWSAHRKSLRRGRWSVPIDPELAAALQPASGAIESAILDRLALCEYRASLAADPSANPAMVRSWNSALELASLDRRTTDEQNRWKYVRRRLRAHAPADILA